MSPLDEKQGVVDDECPTHLGDQATHVLEKYPWLDWLIPAALCTVMLGQLLLSVRQLSQTADEATHLYSGYRSLKCGDFTVSPEHPPLAKAIAAAPLLPMNFAVDCAPFKGGELQQAFVCLNWLYSQNWPAALARARVAVSIFAVGLCLLIWITARRMFGLTTAVVASLLLIFEPNVLAYGALVLTDIPVTCMLLFAVLGFYLWVRHPTAPFLLLTALATGLTLLSKNSGMAVVPILGALAITDALTQPDGNRPRWKLALRNLLALALIGALALGIVWACYGILFAAHSPLQQLQQPRPPATSAFKRVVRLLLPQPYLDGFTSALTLSHQGSVAFVAGRIYLHAPWFSTPLNFLIRSTPAMLAMILAAAFGVALTIRQRRRERLFLLVPAALYLAVCIYASINVSVRYLLPMFPFLLIAVADGCVELARRVRWVSYALPCLLVLHAASSLHAYPNYLSYANDLWGGPSQAYKYESWLDLGAGVSGSKSLPSTASNRKLLVDHGLAVGPEVSTTCPAKPSVSTYLTRYRLACTVPSSSAALYLQTCEYRRKSLRRRLRTLRPKTTSAAAPCWFMRAISIPAWMPPRVKGIWRCRRLSPDSYPPPLSTPRERSNWRLRAQWRTVICAC